MPPETLEEVITGIRVDLMGIKTDVVWLKRGFTCTLIIVAALAGIDLTGFEV